MLIARRLRHILQYAQPLSDSSLPIGWQLLPLRQHIIFYVRLLLRGQPFPILICLLDFYPLLRRHAIELFTILQNSLLLLRAQILKASGVRSWRTVRIEIRAFGIVARVGLAIPADHAHRFGLPVLRLPVRRGIVARTIIVRPIVLGSPVFLLLTALLPRRFCLLLSRLLWRPVLTFLCRTRQRQQRNTCRREQPPAELDPPFHFTLRLSPFHSAHYIWGFV